MIVIIIIIHRYHHHHYQAKGVDTVGDGPVAVVVSDTHRCHRNHHYHLLLLIVILLLLPTPPPRLYPFTHLLIPRLRLHLHLAHTPHFFFCLSTLRRQST